MRHWRTTGNSNMAIQTGGTYISDSMTDITTLPTANLGFSTMASSQKVNRKIQNRSSYTTGTKTDSVEIPTASPGFSTMASPNKVSPSDCNNARQPEMVLWPPKPEIHTSLALRQIWWQFQRQIRGVRPRPAGRKWLRATAITTNNLKW